MSTAPFHFVAALVACLTLAGCAQLQPAAGQPRCFTDQAGRRVCPNAAASAASFKPIDPQALYQQIGGQKLAPSIVRVICEDDGRTTSHGTGTVIEVYDDGTGLIATNEHIVREMRRQPAGEVVFADGSAATFIVQWVNPVWDLAIIEARLPAWMQAVELAEADPAIGDALMIAGYGGTERKLTWQAGRHTAKQQPMPGGPQIALELRPCVARSGDSGGPVLNEQGQLTGVLWGAARVSYNDGYTQASPCRCLLAGLRQVRARLQRRLRGQLAAPLPRISRPPAIGPGDLPGPAPRNDLPPRRDDPPSQRDEPPAETPIGDVEIPAADPISPVASAEPVVAAAGDLLLTKILPWALASITGVGGIGAAGWLATKGSKLALGWLRSRKAVSAAAPVAGDLAEQLKPLVDAAVGGRLQQVKSDLGQLFADRLKSAIGQVALPAAQPSTPPAAQTVDQASPGFQTIVLPGVGPSIVHPVPYQTKSTREYALEKAIAELPGKFGATGANIAESIEVMAKQFASGLPKS